MSKCSVIVGYFYEPKNIKYFLDYGTSHTFTDNVRLFDSSCSYTPYISYLVVGIFIYFLLENLLHVKELFMTILNSSSPNQDPLAMKQLRK
ncbi:hypothetical protein I4U23_005833 [Adineta vaga]|nr:hypothetical protein I4U23_005833 [Adineta vaga]